MNEIWKDINGFEGYYQVSNMGRVRSVDREVTYSNGTIHHHKCRILKGGPNYQGYLHLNLQGNGKHQSATIHKLVALHFVDGYKEGLEVNHIDEDKLNNRADNLEWCTGEYNQKHGTARKRRAESYKRGDYPKRCKALVVYKDGVKIGEYNGFREVADALGFTVDYVSQLANGRKHKHYVIEQKRPRSFTVWLFRDGNPTAIYPSISSASKAEGVSEYVIRYYANKGKPFHGILWKIK